MSRKAKRSNNFNTIKVKVLDTLSSGESKMFFPWYQSCFNPESNSPENYRQRKLKFLKFMRDNLETRLAAINAAIETIERQNRQD